MPSALLDKNTFKIEEQKQDIPAEHLEISHRDYRSYGMRWKVNLQKEEKNMLMPIMKDPQCRKRNFLSLGISYLPSTDQ